jgi:hypothetical protein
MFGLFAVVRSIPFEMLGIDFGRAMKDRTLSRNIPGTFISLTNIIDRISILGGTKLMV